MELLVNRSSPITHLQNMNISSVLKYLNKEKKKIENVINQEFSMVPRCRYNITLFESAGKYLELN